MDFSLSSKSAKNHKIRKSIQSSRTLGQRTETPLRCELSAYNERMWQG